MRELPTLSQPLNRIADALAYLVKGVSSGVSSATVISLRLSDRGIGGVVGAVFEVGIPALTRLKSEHLGNGFS